MLKKISFYIFLFFLLFLFIFLFLEISIRTYLTYKHFNNPHVNYWGKTWYKSRWTQYKISKFDKDLKNDLKKSSFKNVDIPRWKKGSNITINENRFRENESNVLNFKNKKKILAIGDSFTFGDQVSNNETWPSYLEKKTKIKVLNGGHPGYSAGQSLRKAIILSKKANYDYLIWSLIYDDFERDFNNKFIIKKNKKLIFNSFRKNPDFQIEDKNFYEKLKENLFFVYILDRELISKIYEKKYQKPYIPVMDSSFDFDKIELLNFLINEFKKIKIENKLILIQHSDQSDNTNENHRINREEQIDKKYANVLFQLTKQNKILVLDTKKIFETIPKEKKRYLWHDHHTPQGNEIVADFIINEVNFWFEN